MSAGLLAIIIVNWNGGETTLGCLESLGQLDYRNAIVVVVDNGSTDGSPEVIRRRFTRRQGAFPTEATGSTPDEKDVAEVGTATATGRIVLIEAGRNLGFTGGNNLGLRWALEQGADYALLLNNDTIVPPKLATILVQAVKADPAIGMAAPTIHYFDPSQHIWAAGGSFDWRRGETCLDGFGQKDEGQFGAAPREVDFLTGCALLVTRAALQKAGFLDERFFAYYEDAEWCWRARRAGFKVMHVPAAHIWHKISPLAREASPLVQYYMTRNRLLFLRLARAGLGAWVHALVLEDLRTLLSWSLKPRWRHKGPQRKAMLRALGDAFRGRWGMLGG